MECANQTKVEQAKLHKTSSSTNMPAHHPGWYLLQVEHRSAIPWCDSIALPQIKQLQIKSFLEYV
jgi:hypothetical protein